MLLEESLKILDLDATAGFEDIKRSYRNMAKEYHPDCSNSNGEQFKRVNEAYHFLLKNPHLIKTARYVKPVPKGIPIYWRVLDPQLQSDHRSYFDRVELYYDNSVESVLWCMWRGEFRVSLEKGIKLPKTIEIKNFEDPLFLRIIDIYGTSK